MKLSELSPNPENPRKITAEQQSALKKSIYEFGDLSGFVYNETSEQLVGAHQRQLVMPGDSEIVIEKKYSKPTRTGTTAEGFVIVDGERFSYRQVRWGKQREMAANIAANKHGGEFDNAKLAPWLLELDSFNLDLDLVGFSKEEFEDVCAPFRTMPSEGEDHIPPIPKKTKIKLGDLFQLGEHRVLCGDSTDEKQIKILMNGKKAVLWSADPPYGINHVETSNEKKQSKGYSKIQNDELHDKELQDFIFKAIEAAKPHMKNGFAFYMWHAMKMQSYFAAAAAAAGILFHRQIIWVKPSLVFGRGQYHWRHELCLMGWLKGNECPFYGERNQTSVWEIGRENDKIHPTQKPVAITEIPITNHTKPGEIVIDQFLGSGSTLIACEKMNRKCYGVEIDPLYVDVIINRWQDFSGKKAIKIDTIKS